MKVNQGIHRYSHVLTYILDLLHAKHPIVERAGTHDSASTVGRKSSFDHGVDAGQLRQTGDFDTNKRLNRNNIQ